MLSVWWIAVRRRLILGVMSIGLTKVVVALTQLIMVPVLALSWGITIYGQWLMLSALPMFLAASNPGFGIVAGNRLIAEVARDERDEALKTFQTGAGMEVGRVAGSRQLS